MSTRDTVTAHADLFGWAVTTATHNTANYVRGDKAILVDYSRDGSINTADLYHFYRLDDLHLMDRAGSRHKKEKVLSWLAS